MRLALPLRPEVLSALPLELRLEAERLKGTFRHENPVLGPLDLPFAARLEGERVRPIPLPPPSLEVEGWLRPWGLELEVRRRLPPGRTWGERAFARILEALFAKALEGSLPAGARLPL